MDPTSQLNKLLVQIELLLLFKQISLLGVILEMIKFPMTVNWGSLRRGGPSGQVLRAVSFPGGWGAMGGMGVFSQYLGVCQI